MHPDDDLLDVTEAFSPPDPGEPPDASTCPRCEGTGRYRRLGFPEKACAVCSGTGFIGPDMGEPPYPPPCLHPRCGCGLCDSGHPCPMAENAGPLCKQCREEFEIDPGAYEEFGEHAEGRKRWEALRAEVAAYHAAGATPVPNDADVPW